MVVAAGVEIADKAEESASSVGAPMEVQAPVVVAEARLCPHRSTSKRGQSDTISVKEELRECFGEIGDVYMDGKKTSGSGSQVSMSTQANVGDGMQSSSVLRGLQWSLTDSSEIMRLVVDNPVGVQCETVELKTVGAQTDENEDAGARPVMMAPLRLSTEIPDEAAWRTLTPTTGATAAERRMFDGAGTDRPEKWLTRQRKGDSGGPDSAHTSRGGSVPCCGA